MRQAHALALEGRRNASFADGEAAPIADLEICYQPEHDDSHLKPSELIVTEAHPDGLRRDVLPDRAAGVAAQAHDF